jgi:hypothetical protein
LGLGLWLLALGCPADDGGGGGGATESADDDGGTVGDGTAGSATGVVDGTGVADDTAGPPAGMIPARGISIDWVEANQGVGIPVGLDGAWVGPGERISRLLKNRVTLMRAFWVLEDNWEPREIEAHLILEWPDGTVERRIDSKVVDGAAFIGDLGRVFFWGIEAELTQPGLEYSIELFETDESYAADAPADPPFFPSVEGTPVLLGIEDSYQLIKVVVVPFAYNDGAGCDSVPDTSDETMQLFHDLMLMQNPVDRVEIEVHAPVPWTGNGSYSALNLHMSQLRFDEGALPETYYYGLIDYCSYPDDNVVGQALNIPSDPTSMDAAGQRVSSGYSHVPELTAETFVHEVGHSAGRRHVACNGMEAGVDPSYPFPGGDVGEWGFGVVDFQLRHPTVNKDYMTYCSPTWVGTWGWNKIQPVVETLSTWDADYPGAQHQQEPSDPYSGSVMMGVTLPDGEERWITIPGAVTGTPDPSDTEIVFERDDGSVLRQPAVVQVQPDGDDLVFLAPLPPDFDRVVSITRRSGGREHAIDRALVAEHHQQRLVARTPTR